MAKVLKTAAIIVGAVALIATGVGAVGGGAILGTTFATIGTVAGVTSAVLSTAAAALTKTTLPATTISGNQNSFTASLDQGLPWLLGLTRSAGCAVHDITYDAVGTTANDFQTFYGVWSADRCYAVESTQIDNVTIDFSAANATAGGSYANWMWHRSQLGLSPETGALKAIDDYQYPPGWSTSAKLSGMSAFSWTLRFDPKGVVYPGGTVPQKRDIIKGALAYDPRKDSTYPGGSGAHRATDESTWEWTENPFLLALKWARGVYSNGKRVLGIGMALAAINLDSAVQAANIADANGWKAGGVVYSTDPNYDVLKKICAAGSGEPIRVGGMLYFLVDAPKVSLDTITTDDLIGKCTAPSGTRMKDRINGVIPTYREPAQDWQLVPATKVTIADYVTADGRPRTKAITWELVQDVSQVAKLATYAICNAREIDGIVLPCKVRWIGYKPGDAVTVSSSVVAMDSQLIVLRKRNLDPASGAVTFTARTETTGKHALALGQTTTAPPTPALATVDRTGLLNPGVSAAWSAIANDNGARPADGATRNVPRGPWNGATIYGLGDMVTYSGSSYVALGPVPAGTVPTNATYWTLLVAAGIPGAPGANGQPSYVHVAYANSADGSTDFVTGVANPGRTYIGLYTDSNSAGSGSYTAYYWSRLTGEDGTDGSNGVPGMPGANGQTPYVHFAYADASDGSSGFSFSPGTHKYVGIYSDFTSASSGSYTAYAWSLIKGADGATGGIGAPGANGTNGVDGLAALNIHTVGAVSWDGHNLLCPTRCGNWNTNGAYSSNVIPGGVALTFQRPNFYDSQAEDAFVGIASAPTATLDYPAVQFAWRMWKNGGNYYADTWVSGGGRHSEGWSGSNTYSIRYDTNTGQVTWYRYDGSTTTAVDNYYIGTGLSFGFEATAGGSMSLTNVAFTAAGGTGATGAAGTPGPPGANGSNGISPSPKYVADPVSGEGTWNYSAPVPLENGQTVTFESYIANAFSSTHAGSATITVQSQASLDNSSWGVMTSGSLAQSVAPNSDLVEFDVNGTYTNTSGGRQLVYLRTVVGRTGNSDAVFGYSGGFGQAS